MLYLPACNWWCARPFFREFARAQLTIGPFSLLPLFRRHSPLLPNQPTGTLRAKDVGWWIVLGTEQGELLALKRVGTLGPRGYKTTLRFPSPEEAAAGGRVPLVLHVVADGVMGMDRQARSTVTVS